MDYTSIKWSYCCYENRRRTHSSSENWEGKQTPPTKTTAIECIKLYLTQFKNCPPHRGTRTRRPLTPELRFKPTGDFLDMYCLVRMEVWSKNNRGKFFLLLISTTVSVNNSSQGKHTAKQTKPYFTQPFFSSQSFFSVNRRGFSFGFWLNPLETKTHEEIYS